LDRAGSTGSVIPDFELGGLELSAEQLRNAFWFDVEAVQTKSIADSHEIPPRPEYAMIQVAMVSEEAMVSPDNAEYMRCVLFWLRSTNCPFMQHTHPARAVFDCVDEPHAQVPSASTHGFAHGLSGFVQKHASTTLCSARRLT